MANTHITDAEFLRWPATKQLLEALKQANIEARFVGGCVRDALLDREVTDVDLASPTPPEEALHALSELDLKVIPTGIEHGTITIVVDSIPFELTTLRHDVDCDGRHAIVAYTTDWEADAKRRDFTVNALYANAKGDIYDYTNGIADLNAKKLQFIGDASERIKEDALRILRLFRFQAQLDFSVSDELYEQCKKHVKLLGNMSGERIYWEIFKLLTTPNPIVAWQALFDYGIAKKLFDGLLAPDMDIVLEVGNQLNWKSREALHRFILLAYLADEPDSDQLKSILKLSNQQSKLLKRVLNHAHHIQTNISLNEQHKWHYLLTSEIYILCIVANAAQLYQKNKQASLESYKRMVADAYHWEPPEFPLRGADLIKLGYSPGENMGKLLHHLESQWIESGFTLSKDQLLVKAAA